MSNPTALIIEDDVKLATIFAEALRLADYETECVKDGATALERLAVVTPALVVLDLHLPGVPGSIILNHIRNDQRLVETRVMVATADAQLAMTMQSEADLVLLKPISFAQLRTLALRLRPAK